MAVTPVVRYMLLCEDCVVDPANPRRVSIIGLLSHFNPINEPPYPAFCEELCVFLTLTEARGPGKGRIVVTFEETGERVLETPEHLFQFGRDPLEVSSKLFRIRDFSFPRSGRHLVEFWYDGVKLEERPLLLR